MIDLTARCINCDKSWTASQKLTAALVLAEAAIHSEETGHHVELNGLVVQPKQGPELVRR